VWQQVDGAGGKGHGPSAGRHFQKSVRYPISHLQDNAADFENFHQGFGGLENIKALCKVGV